MKVIIPLAGKGTRLRPHTHTVPKPMLKVAGKPVMDYVMEDVAKLKGVVHKPQGGFVGRASGDIVADQVPEQRRRTGKESGQTTGVAAGDVDAVLAAVLEVNQGALAAEFCDFPAPGFPGLSCLVNRRRLRVPHAHVVGQISRPPRGGVEGRSHRGGSVIIVGTPHPPNLRLRL